METESSFCLLLGWRSQLNFGVAQRLCFWRRCAESEESSGDRSMPVLDIAGKRYSILV